MASPAAPWVVPSEAEMDGSTGARMRKSTDTRNARVKRSRSGVTIARSRVEEIGPARAGEAPEAVPPARGEPRQRPAALDVTADLRPAAEEIDGQALPLELVGRPPPAEAPAGLTPRLRDERDIGEVGPESRAVGDVHLHALAAAPAPLVEGGLEGGGPEAHAGQRAALQRHRQARAVEIGRAHPLEGPRGAASLGH